MAIELFGFTINTEKLGLEITGKTTRDTEVFVSQVHSNSKCTGFIKKNDSFLLLNNIDIRQKTLVDVCRLLKNTKRPFTLYVSRKRKNTYLTRERMVSIDCFRSRTSQIAHVTKESIKINDEFYCYDVSAVRLINKNNDGHIRPNEHTIKNTAFNRTQQIFVPMENKTRL